MSIEVFKLKNRAFFSIFVFLSERVNKPAPPPPPFVAGLTPTPSDGQDKNILFKSSKSYINDYDS
jgi:hypothetical protein